MWFDEWINNKHINYFAGDDEGRPACRPTPEARKEIHAVMVKTFGEKNAAEIEENFEKCAEAHIGKWNKGV